MNQRETDANQCTDNYADPCLTVHGLFFYEKHKILIQQGYFFILNTLYNRQVMESSSVCFCQYFFLLFSKLHEIYTLDLVSRWSE